MNTSPRPRLTVVTAERVSVDERARRLAAAAADAGWDVTLVGLADGTAATRVVAGAVTVVGAPARFVLSRPGHPSPSRPPGVRGLLVRAGYRDPDALARAKAAGRYRDRVGAAELARLRAAAAAAGASPAGRARGALPKARSLLLRAELKAARTARTARLRATTVAAAAAPTSPATAPPPGDLRLRDLELLLGPEVQATKADAVLATGAAVLGVAARAADRLSAAQRRVPLAYDARDGIAAAGGGPDAAMRRALQADQRRYGARAAVRLAGSEAVAPALRRLAEAAGVAPEPRDGTEPSAYAALAAALAPGAQAVAAPAPVAQGRRTGPALVIGPKNFAGQGWAYAEALRRHRPGIAVECHAVLRGGPVSFPCDVPIEGRQWRSLDWQLGQVRRIVTGSTHVLIETASSIFGTLGGREFDADLPILREHGITVGLLLHGTEVRDPRRHRDLEAHSPYAVEDDWTAANQAAVDRLLPKILGFDGPVFVTTMDLRDYVPDATWLPVVVDTDDWRPGPPVMERARPVVVHAPSDERKKGSATVDRVAGALHEAGRIEYRRLQAVPPAEMPAAIAAADIVLDQFALGDYGVLAAQAMAAGRVVVGHVADRVRNRLPADLPIIEATVDDLAAVLERVLDDRPGARAAAAAGPAYVGAWHDGRRAAQVLSEFLGAG